MATFNSKEDFRERILKNQNKEAQCLVLHRFVATIFQEKYADKDVEVNVAAYSSGEPTEIVVIDKSTQKVLESYQDEEAVDCNILDMVYDQETKETKLDVINEDKFERIWQLYRSVEPEEVNEDKSFESIPDNQVLWIPINDIKPNPFQIREDFADVETLAKSIKRNGLLQPIVVKLVEGEYVLLDGERRWRAVKSLGWKNIRALQVSDSADLDLLGLAGNFQRSNPNPIAAGRKIASIRMEIKRTNKWGKYTNIIPEDKRLELNLDDPFSSCKEIDELITEELGFSRTQQYNLVKLLKEPDEVQDLIKKGDFSIAEGAYTINLSHDLPEEFVRALKAAEKRKSIIEKVEKKARDTDDPNSKLLKYFSQLEKVRDRYKVGYESYYEKADEKTRLDVKERVRSHVIELINIFGLEELGEE